MKKLILVLLVLFHSLFAAEQTFLEPDEAFKPKFIQENDKLIFDLKLGEDIYLYDETVKIFILKPNKEEITKDISLPTPVLYEEWMVQLNDINIKIPFSLLQSKVDSPTYKIQIQYQGCSKKGICYVPMKQNFDLDITENASLKSNIVMNNTIAEDKTPNLEELANETDSIANTLKSKNMFLVLATFFGFGLLLSLTPCVLPMIPILSSIIVKAGNEQKITVYRGFFLSLIYVLSMAIAYTLAGVIAGLFGANLQVALQNPYVLTVFAAIFVALAFSMFGYYKLEIPQSIQNKINKTTEGKEKQGITGIAIMGFLSALIVGPCVAPPLAGALIYIGQTGDAFLGGLALFVMSMGMGVPLLIIGAGAGSFMLKPGGWMNSVSKIFGIVMLAVAVWMLDRVLDATLVMYLWALLLLGTAIYLKIYKHILAQLITVVIFIFGVTLFIGAVSGATNPLEPLNKFTSAKGVIALENKLEFLYVKNLEELDLAIKASDKPVMLDFYADWCISCKELENGTFKDKSVVEKLKGFTLLKADVTENNDDDKAMQAKFGVVGPPSLIFWDKNNEEIKASQIVGYKNAKDFLNIVNKHF